MTLNSYFLKTDTFANVHVRGKVLKIVREQYLRDDISCQSFLCPIHQDHDKSVRVGFLPKVSTHYLIPFYDVVLKFLEVLEIPQINGVIFLQSHVTRLLHECGKRQYGRALDIVRDMRKGCTLFLNEFHASTHLNRDQDIPLHQWLEESTYKVATWYLKHLDHVQRIVLVTEQQQVIEKYKDETQGIFVISLDNYLKSFWPDVSAARELYDSISASLLEEPADLPTGQNEGKLFARHWSQEQLEVGLKNSQLLQGRIHLNKYSDVAYLIITSNKDAVSERDILLPNGKLRNRAIHGDQVAVQILPQQQWENYQRDKNQRVGRVVGIIQRQWRDYVATFPEDVQDVGGKAGRYLLVTPYDRRIPRVRLRTTRARELANQRVIIRLDKWEWDSQYPQGHLVKTLGPTGNLETEVSTLLVEHSISVLPFSAGLLSELPTGNEWAVDDQEALNRRDLRDSHLVFSIDPKGCQDVDDVLSVRKLSDTKVELGVHIADVCHFVQPSTLCDLEARARATSVYLSDRRFDMLPSVLSTDLCSLRSLQDRYAVSVIWEVEYQTGQVLSVWFGRTIVNSSYQLNYEIAQAILDGEILDMVINEIPELLQVPPGLAMDRFCALREALQQLTHLSRCLQLSRYREGVLQLDSLEVQFEFEQDNAQGQQVKAPKPKQHLEVHETVAECMITANHWVAQKIRETFPQQSLLRLHPPPNAANLEKLRLAARSCGFDLDTSSNQELAKSLDIAVTADPHVNTILRLLGTRAMNEARYVSTGSHSDCYHYGLGLLAYTHFTSPIRRYADIMVHRLLLSCCSETREENLMPNQELEDLCQHLNNKNRAAKEVQKASSELFQALYFQHLSPADPARICEAIVYSVRPKGLVVLVPQYGLKGNVRLMDSQELVAHLQDDHHLQWLHGHLDHDAERNTLTVSPIEGQVQTYRLFDHIQVKIDVVKSQAHAPRLSLELVRRMDKSSYLTSPSVHQKGIKLPDLVEAIKIANMVHTTDTSMDTSCAPKEDNLYHLLLRLKELALSDGDCT